MPKRFKLHTDMLERLITGMCSLLAYLPTKAVLGCALLLVLGAVAAERWWLKTQDNPGLFLSPNAELVAMDQAINAIDQQLEPGTFIVVSGKNSEDVYQKVAAFKQSLAAYDLSEDTISSITELLPSDTQQQINREHWQQLTSPGGPVAQYLTKLGLAPEPKSLSSNAPSIASPADLINSAPNSLPPLWYAHDDGVTNLMLIRQGTDLTTLATVAASTDGVYYFRALDEASRALASQRRAATIALLAAYALVAIGLLMRYRRWHALAIVALPAVATAVVIMVMSGLAMPLTIFHVMAFYLVLGLGLDYGIFVYAMNNTKRTTRQAIFLSALTSSLSFGLLALSSMPLVQSFGLTLLLANTINCLGAFFYSTKLANLS
jgi:predicted exporter